MTVTVISTAVRKCLFGLLCARMRVRNRTKLFNHIMKQEAAFFDKMQTGDLTNRLSSDCQTMCDNLGPNLNSFFESAVGGCALLVAMVKVNWNLSILTRVRTVLFYRAGHISWSSNSTTAICR